MIPFDDIEDAVRLANDSQFGLAASVYAASTPAAPDIARRIRSGTVAVNTAGMSLTQPFGGVKRSGWGASAGPKGSWSSPTSSRCWSRAERASCRADPNVSPRAVGEPARLTLASSREPRRRNGEPSTPPKLGPSRGDAGGAEPRRQDGGSR
ncbi:aldehyde dehydrogenase family protein [Pseudonocardia sp. NPDC049154]|uniref:aldehyde dehydrogenase family protein n=1 Tax=Pseudonocardia sp. NPDC049154 TaxID=3155501 RepID=UPI00340F3CB4